MGDLVILESSRLLASIIVTCKGRLHHLRRTLSCMLAQVTVYFPAPSVGKPAGRRHGDRNSFLGGVAM